MERRHYSVIAIFLLCSVIGTYALPATLVELCKAKQKEIALLEKQDDKIALERAKQELAALFMQVTDNSHDEIAHNIGDTSDELPQPCVNSSYHAGVHHAYFTSKSGLNELSKEIEFLNAVLFNYHLLTRQEQLLFDEIKAFLTVKQASMIKNLQFHYDQWLKKLDQTEGNLCIKQAHIIKNQLQLLTWYFNALKMVRMQVELLTIDTHHVRTLATPVNQMLQEHELQSACMAVATELFEHLQTWWKQAAHEAFEIDAVQQSLLPHEIMILLKDALPPHFHGSWLQRWLGHTAQSLLVYDLYSQYPVLCNEYLMLQIACMNPETFADKVKYKETADALDALYQKIQEHLEGVSQRESIEGLTYKILIYKVLGLKKDLQKLEHYQYDVAKEGVAAKHAVLLQQASVKKIFTTKAFASYGDQYQKLVDMYLYNQAKPSLLMFELYKLAAQLKSLKDQHRLSSVMWLIFKENAICQVIDDMIYILEYIALDISNSKGFEKNSIIEHILAGAWAAQNGGPLNKKSFFSDIAQKLFGKSDAEVKNQALNALGYASPILANVAYKMLKPYLADEDDSKESRSKSKVSDEKSSAQAGGPLFDPKLLESLASQWNFQQPQ